MGPKQCKSPSHHWDATMRDAASVHFCGDCGEHFDDLECDCDGEHASGARFCVQCGEPSEVATASEQADSDVMPVDEVDIEIVVEDGEGDNDSGYGDETSNPIIKIDLTDVLKQVG